MLREIFDSLDDGDFQISRAEYVRLMGTRGVSAAEAEATFSDMDHNGSNLMTVAKMQHYVQIRAGKEKRIARSASTATRRRPTPSPSSSSPTSSAR